jgi:hypothetical protein
MLQFSVEASWFPYKVIKVLVPIIIGTVPLSTIKPAVDIIAEIVAPNEEQQAILKDDPLQETSSPEDDTNEEIVPDIIVEDTDIKLHRHISKSKTLRNDLEPTKHAAGPFGTIKGSSDGMVDIRNDKKFEVATTSSDGREYPSSSNNTLSPIKKLEKPRRTSVGKTKVSDSRMSSPERKHAFKKDNQDTEQEVPEKESHDIHETTA